MMLQRVINVALITVGLVLAVANVAAYFERQEEQQPATRPATTWDRWLAMSNSQRRARIRQYQQIVRHTGGLDTLRNARAYMRLSAAEQDRLRELARLVDEELRQMPPGQRRELLQAVGRARAFRLHQALRAEAPERLAQLRAAWSAPP